jgi:serine protease Do
VYHERIGELDDIPNLQKSLVPGLNVFVTGLDGRVKPLLHGIRSDSGIVVLAQAAGATALDTGLQAGDIIRKIDRTPLQSTSQLQEIVHKLSSGDPVVLQVERNGHLQYLAFEME